MSAKKSLMALRKISLATCEVKPDIVAIRAAAEKSPDGMFLLRVLGRAEKIINRQTQYGDGIAYGLQGQFKATNYAGREFFSAIAFLPQDIQATAQLALSPDKDGVVPENVEFGFDVYAVPSPRDANKYEFRVKSLIAVQASDPLEALEANISAPLPMLAAPAATANVTPIEAAPAAEKKAANGKK